MSRTIIVQEIISSAIEVDENLEIDDAIKKAEELYRGGTTERKSIEVSGRAEIEEYHICIDERYNRIKKVFAKDRSEAIKKVSEEYYASRQPASDKCFNSVCFYKVEVDEYGRII